MYLAASLEFPSYKLGDRRIANSNPQTEQPSAPDRRRISAEATILPRSTQQTFLRRAFFGKMMVTVWLQYSCRQKSAYSNGFASAETLE